jgi:Ca-activated chloride channel family protein
MDELEKGEFATQEYADYKNQYQWMGALAFLFFAVALIIPSYSSKN